MSTLRLVGVVIGAVLLGAGSMLAFMPHRESIEFRAAGNETEQATLTGTLECGPPILDAFDDGTTPAGGWFAYAPNTGVVLSDDSWCVDGARRRAAWGAVSAVVGVVLLAVCRRGMTPG